MNLRALVALVRKDVILYFSNRRALLMSLAAPIAIAAFFGSLFGDDRNGPSQVPIALVDHDGSELSKRVVDALRADRAFDVRPLDEAAANVAVDRGKLRAVVTIEAGFGDRAPTAFFGRQDKPAIAVRYDPSQAITLQLVEGLLAKHVMEIVAQSTFALGNDGTSVKALADVRARVAQSTTIGASRRRDLEGLFDALDRVRQDAGGDPPAAGDARPAGFSVPYELQRTQASARPESRYNSYAHAFAGMGVQFILFMGIDFGIKLLLARRLGLWTRLRAAPLSRTLLIASQVASGASIAALLFALVMGAGIAVFGVRVDGSVAGFVALIVAFALLTSSFGLLIAAIGKTPDATRGLAIFATLVMVMLGGAWVPAFVFPAWLQTASLAVPTRWAVDGFDAVTWRGLGLDAALPPIAVMLAFAVAFFAIAVWRFDWDEA